jgi:hypothetical protein
VAFGTPDRENEMIFLLFYDATVDIQRRDKTAVAHGISRGPL